MPMSDLAATMSRYAPSRLFHRKCAECFQGHVDTTAILIEKKPDGDSLRLLFQLPEESSRESLLPCLILKGYVALDGTSLTITSVDNANRTFGVMLITHTQEKITLSKKSIGSKVNVEVDMVGKYVQKSVVAAFEGSAGLELRRIVERIVEDILGRGEVAV